MAEGLLRIKARPGLPYRPQLTLTKELNVGGIYRAAKADPALELDGVMLDVRNNSLVYVGTGMGASDTPNVTSATLCLTEPTYNPKTNRLYIHLLAYPACGLYVAFPDRIARAAFLHDGSELKCRPFDFAGHANELGDTKENDTALGVIALPTVQPSVEVPVVELVLK